MPDPGWRTGSGRYHLPAQPEAEHADCPGSGSRLMGMAWRRSSSVWAWFPGCWIHRQLTSRGHTRPRAASRSPTPGSPAHLARDVVGAPWDVGAGHVRMMLIWPTDRCSDPSAWGGSRRGLATDGDRHRRGAHGEHHGRQRESPVLCSEVGRVGNWMSAGPKAAERAVQGRYRQLSKLGLFGRYCRLLPRRSIRRKALCRNGFLPSGQALNGAGDRDRTSMASLEGL